MQQREISRTPNCPDLSEKELGNLELLCFGPTALPKKAEALFIFGTTHGVAELVLAAAKYIQTFDPALIIISGGCPNYSDSPKRAISEAEEISQKLIDAGFKDLNTRLETQALNMQENVTLSLPHLKAIHGSVAFIGKCHGLTRFGATLRRHISNELVPISFDADFDGLLLSRYSWKHHAALRSRVWGEALRLYSYSRKSDIRLTDAEQLLLSNLTHQIEAKRP